MIKDSLRLSLQDYQGFVGSHRLTTELDLNDDKIRCSVV